MATSVSSAVGPLGRRGPALRRRSPASAPTRSRPCGISSTAIAQSMPSSSAMPTELGVPTARVGIARAPRCRPRSHRRRPAPAGIAPALGPQPTGSSDRRCLRVGLWPAAEARRPPWPGGDCSNGRCGRRGQPQVGQRADAARRRGSAPRSRRRARRSRLASSGITELAPPRRGPGRATAPSPRSAASCSGCPPLGDQRGGVALDAADRPRTAASSAG